MSAEEVDRPRPGGNQFGAGSPSAVQQVAVERFSMTDVAVDPGTWVPRLGDSEIPEGHAELIRGLYGLAAWLADHPEVPTPHVLARVSPGFDGWAAECGVVDRVADALGVQPEAQADGGHYVAESTFGPIEFQATAVTHERMARFDAEWSYRGHVTPDEDLAGDV